MLFRASPPVPVSPGPSPRFDFRAVPINSRFLLELTSQPQQKPNPQLLWTVFPLQVSLWHSRSLPGCRM